MTFSLDTDKIRKAVLNWYDKYGRDLPWRVKGGHKADAYHVWLSEVMCQQTTIPAVMPYYQRFLEKWPTVHNLAEAKQDEVMHEWAGLGYYARARNLHKCAKVVSEDLNGNFPGSSSELKTLPGIGDYTAAAIAAIVFNEPAPVIDGNVERVAARIFAFEKPIPSHKSELKKLAALLYSGNEMRPGDLAQAYMDLGAMICTPKSPKCSICPAKNECAAVMKGIAADLPQKDTKKNKPKRCGKYYWVCNSKGEVLFHRRDESRMLGGMLALPSSNWDLKKDGTDISFNKISKLGSNHTIRHSFTHFDLELEGYSARLENTPSNCIWLKKDEISETGLPSLFKKAVKLMI